LDRAAPLPERFVLVPFQVRKDSQLILHSPLIGNDMRRLLILIQQAVTKIDPRLRIVAKLHPREQLHVQRRNLELIREFPQVTFVSNVAIRDLLARAAAVVTINSTVGFEAFLYDKPVVSLGRNFYTAPHLVELVTAEHELTDALARALARPIQFEHRRAFLRFVYSRFLVHGMYDDYSERSLGAVADRIRQLLGRVPGACGLSAPLRP
jgi:capsular polysaccharide export protein